MERMYVERESMEVEKEVPKRRPPSRTPFLLVPQSDNARMPSDDPSLSSHD